MTRIQSVFAQLVIFSLLTLLFACTETPQIAASLSEEEVAELLEATFSEINGGLTEELVSITESLEELTLEDLCDSLYSDSLLYEFGPQSGREASLEADWSFEMSCGGLLELPESATLVYNSEVAYSTPRIVSDDAASFSGNVSGLLVFDPSYIWSGTYQRSATQELLFRSQNDYGSDLDITLTNVEVSKGAEPSILGGAGTFSLDVTQDGTSSTYAGTLTFNGDGTATLVINGMTYTISLN